MFLIQLAYVPFAVSPVSCWREANFLSPPFKKPFIVTVDVPPPPNRKGTGKHLFLWGELGPKYFRHSGVGKAGMELSTKGEGTRAPASPASGWGMEPSLGAGLKACHGSTDSAALFRLKAWLQSGKIWEDPEWEGAWRWRSAFYPTRSWSHVRGPSDLLLDLVTNSSWIPRRALSYGSLKLFHRVDAGSQVSSLGKAKGSIHELQFSPDIKPL